MAALVTLEQARMHLRISDTVEDDPDIQMKLEQASDIVLDYIKQRDAPWTPTTVPRPVQAAVLIMLSRLFDDRAAGVENNQVALGYLPPSVTALLHRYRDPALA